MKYEKPMMQVITLEAEDVITLSIGKDDYDPTINSNSGTNPWAQ